MPEAPLYRAPRSPRVHVGARARARARVRARARARAGVRARARVRAGVRARVRPDHLGAPCTREAHRPVLVRV